MPCNYLSPSLFSLSLSFSVSCLRLCLSVCAYGCKVRMYTCTYVYSAVLCSVSVHFVIDTILQAMRVMDLLDGVMFVRIIGEELIPIWGRL